MNVLFFSHIYFGNIEEWLSSAKRLPGMAISNYEKGFVESLVLNEEVNLTLINRPFLSQSAPSIDNQNLKSDDTSINIIDTPFFVGKKQDLEVSKYIKNNHCFEEIIKKSEIVLFSTYHDFRLFEYIKRINPACKSFLFLPDLPHFIVNHSSFLHRVHRKVEAYKFEKKCSAIDGLFPITDSIGVFLQRKIKQFVSIQGTVKKEDVSHSQRTKNTKTIVYSGGLSEKYGILELINAFLKSDFSKNYKLIICGKGECETKISELSNRYQNISFLGFIPRTDCLEIIKNATFLVVPENPINDYSKYSFHSKIIEYMASGVPTIAYFYYGIPLSYRPYLLEIKRDSGDVEKEIEATLNYYYNLSFEDNLRFGNEAKTFIVNNNSVENNSLKIYSFIKKIQEV